MSTRYLHRTQYANLTTAELIREGNNLSTRYLHRTQYANLTTEELIREAYTEVQSKALTALGRELLFRLEHLVDNSVDNSVDVFGL